MATELDFAPLVDLVTALEAAEVRAALDPAQLNLPGAWVTLESVQATNVARDLKLWAVVYLITADQDYHRALDALAVMFNQVVPDVFTPDGPVVPQGVILPDSSTPLPGLRVPVRLT